MLFMRFDNYVLQFVNMNEYQQKRFSNLVHARNTPNCGCLGRLVCLLSHYGCYEKEEDFHIHKEHNHGVTNMDERSEPSHLRF